MTRTAVFLAAVALVAADWPSFRGNPAQTGVTADPLPATLAVVWQVPTGDGQSGSVDGAVAVVGDAVYAASFDGFAYSLALKDGAVRWKAKVGPTKAPVGVHDGAVYVGNLDGFLLCLDAATGAVRWKYEAGGEITSGTNFAGGGVLFGAGDETLYCLDGKTGTERWKFQVAGGPVNGTPAVAGGLTFAAGCDSHLHALDVATGKERGSVDLGGQVGASAAVRDGVLYVGTMGDELLAVTLGDKLAVKWRYSAARKKAAFYSSAAVTDALVLAGSRDRRLIAVDRATGVEKWGFATDKKVDSSPVVVGDRVLVGSDDKHLYVLGLDGKERQRFALDGAVGGSPAVGGGRVVVGTGKGTVYCLGAK